MLLAGAGLLVRSVIGFESTPHGFRPHRIAVARGTLPRDRYADSAHRLAFYDQLAQKLGGLPAVDGAAIASLLPHVWSLHIRLSSDLAHGIAERLNTC
jgi:putative ABC transport system permease protein